MAQRTRGRGLFALVAGAAIGIGCGSNAVKNRDAGTIAIPDAGGTDAVVTDADPQAPIACRVALDDALNPCAPTSLEQSMRYQGTDFAFSNGCFAGIVFETNQAGEFWQCVYGGADGGLVAWNRVGRTSLCGGADAVVADAWSMGQAMSCLATDQGGWKWVLGFDPGPTTIAVQLATATTGPTDKISIGLGFKLEGREIAGSDLTLRYWYTADARGSSTPPPQSVSCDGFNFIRCDAFTIVPVTPPRATADTYVEVGFPTVTEILSTGFDMSLGFSIARADGALFDQSNDYSYNGQTQAAATTRVTAYVKGALIYGVEP
jgi:hypothetical protein